MICRSLSTYEKVWNFSTYSKPIVAVCNMELLWIKGTNNLFKKDDNNSSQIWLFLRRSQLDLRVIHSSPVALRIMPEPEPDPK